MLLLGGILHLTFFVTFYREIFQTCPDARAMRLFYGCCRLGFNCYEGVEVGSIMRGKEGRGYHLVRVHLKNADGQLEVYQKVS